MKRLLFIVCLLTFKTAFSQNTGNISPDTANTKTDDSKVPQIESIQSSESEIISVKYQVFGMNCPGCHGSLEKQISKIPNVTNSKADWVKQEIEIFSNTAISEKDIIKRIKKANFTPGEKIE